MVLCCVVLQNLPHPLCPGHASPGCVGALRLFSHWDHTGGNAELKKLYKGVQVIGPAKEKAKIPGIDVTVQGGDTVQLGSLEAHVLDVGGHTNGHVAYYFPGPGQAFVGDSLFALGCGRMFEGTPEMFWASLQRLRALPDETVVYWCVRVCSPD